MTIVTTRRRNTPKLKISNSNSSCRMPLRWTKL